MRNEDTIELQLLVNADADEMTENEDSSDVWTMSGNLPLNNPYDKLSKVSWGRRKLEKNLITKSEQCLLENLHNEDLEGAQLLPLDAHTLATRALQKRKVSCSSGTPPSSIDLEWENEAVFTHTYKFKSQCNSVVEDVSSNSGCGEASPSDSLEWDPCDPAGMDLETEQLLNEIEQLTNKALNETGDWTNT
ncbi:uncharacterized protein LOC106668024 isoform X2 [Cimex lectularius]|nr:uncharacterized protein LOC106668024 isoform X2 [Cimex lectularius]